MELSKIPPQVLAAVRQRERYTDAEIESLSPQSLFDEYCNWHGLIRWGDTLWQAVEQLKQASQVPSPREIELEKQVAYHRERADSNFARLEAIREEQELDSGLDLPPKVVVWLESGVVQGAVADQMVDVAVIEYDDLADKDECFMVPQADGSDAEAVGGLHDVEIDQARVVELFQAVEERRPVAGMSP